MKAGDLVRHFLTEQIGVVITLGEEAFDGRPAVRVMWTTQGVSLFGAGTKEWCDPRSLEVLGDSQPARS